METLKTKKFTEINNQLFDLDKAIRFEELSGNHKKADSLRAKQEKLQDKSDDLQEKMTIDEQIYLGIYDN